MFTVVVGSEVAGAAVDDVVVATVDEVFPTIFEYRCLSIASIPIFGLDVVVLVICGVVVSSDSVAKTVEVVDSMVLSMLEPVLVLVIEVVMVDFVDIEVLEVVLVVDCIKSVVTVVVLVDTSLVKVLVSSFIGMDDVVSVLALVVLVVVVVAELVAALLLVLVKLILVVLVVVLVVVSVVGLVVIVVDELVFIGPNIGCVVVTTVVNLVVIAGLLVVDVDFVVEYETISAFVDGVCVDQNPNSK